MADEDVRECKDFANFAFGDTAQIIFTRFENAIIWLGYSNSIEQYIIVSISKDRHGAPTMIATTASCLPGLRIELRRHRAASRI